MAKKEIKMTNLIRGAESKPENPETPDPRETSFEPSPFQTFYVIMRCGRWGRYVQWVNNPAGISDPRPQRVQSWWFKLVMVDKVQQIGGGRRRQCPVDILEAEETHRCVKALPGHLRDAIIEEYVVGGSARQKAAALGIEPRAFRHRRGVAHVELLGLFNDVACGIELEVPIPGRGRPPRPMPAS